MLKRLVFCVRKIRFYLHLSFSLDYQCIIIHKIEILCKHEVTLFNVILDFIFCSQSIEKDIYLEVQLSNDG